MRNWKKTKAIYKHRVVFIYTARVIRGKMTISDYLHDLDKIVLLCLGFSPETVSRIHRSYAKHHEQNGIIRDIPSAIIDWECSRFTKSSKPLDARQTWNKYYFHVLGVEEVLDSLNL